MTQDAKKTVLIQVSGMHCGNCVEKVRKSLAALPGVDTVAVDLAAQTARVQFSPAAVTTATPPPSRPHRRLHRRRFHQGLSRESSSLCVLSVSVSLW